MLLLAVPVLADECTDACDAELVLDLEWCEDGYYSDWLSCMALWDGMEQDCEEDWLECRAAADGDPEAEAVCDSLWNVCSYAAHDWLEECEASAEWWRDECIADAELDHVFCIEQCEGTPTRRRTWGTVKVLY